MRVLTKQIAYLVAIAFAGTVLAYPWPFDHATSTQQVVRQTVGAYRAANRLHTGLDIQPLFAISGSVYCVVAGTVTSLNDAGHWVRIDGIAYVHVGRDTSVHL